MRSSTRSDEGTAFRSENELRGRNMNFGETEIDVETFSGSPPNNEGVDEGLLPKVPSAPRPPFPTFPINPSEHPIVVTTGSTPDINAYQHKKTVAQGMMDIALLSANANQLRYVLEIGRSHAYFYHSIALIGISILLQVLVGMCLIWNSRYNVTCDTGMRKAERMNNWLIFGIFIITVANVFISAFGLSFDFPVAVQIPRTASHT